MFYAGLVFMLFGVAAMVILQLPDRHRRKDGGRDIFPSPLAECPNRIRPRDYPEEYVQGGGEKKGIVLPDKTGHSRPFLRCPLRAPPSATRASAFNTCPSGLLSSMGKL